MKILINLMEVQGIKIVITNVLTVLCVLLVNFCWIGFPLSFVQKSFFWFTIYSRKLNIYNLESHSSLFIVRNRLANSCLQHKICIEVAQLNAQQMYTHTYNRKSYMKAKQNRQRLLKKLGIRSDTKTIFCYIFTPSLQKTTCKWRMVAFFLLQNYCLYLCKFFNIGTSRSAWIFIQLFSIFCLSKLLLVFHSNRILGEP